MHVIITGGTGLIGRALSASLAADDHQVTLLSRNPDRAAELPDGVQVARWDAHSGQGWAHLADGADAIVNLAGENIASGLWSKKRKRRIHDSRVKAGQAVVQAVQAAKQKPRVVVQSSGIGYYGPRGDEEIAEDTPAGDDFLSRVALDWEASTASLDAVGVRRPIIRSGAVFSTQGGALPLMRLPFKFFVGGPLGSGQQWLPWIHVADEVRAIRFLIEHSQADGPFNLCAPDTLTNAALMRVLGQVMGRPAFMRVPAWALRLSLGELSTTLLHSQRAVPRRLLELGFTFQFPEAQAALLDLLR
ncbi:MAG: TIGR01777 family oxidoreductase [Anaerolineae bacterium]|jgi:hypothetical protein